MNRREFLGRALLGAVATAAGPLACGSESDDADDGCSVAVSAPAGGGWPSQFRGTPPRASGTLEAEEWVAPIEENGFSLLDFEPDVLRVSLFRWHPDQGEAALDTLEPFRVLEIEREGRAVLDA